MDFGITMITLPLTWNLNAGLQTLQTRLSDSHSDMFDAFTVGMTGTSPGAASSPAAAAAPNALAFPPALLSAAASALPAVSTFSSWSTKLKPR